MRERLSIVVLLLAVGFTVSPGAGRGNAAILSATVTGYGSVPLVDDSFGSVQSALNFGGVTTTNNGITFIGTTVSGDPTSATVASSPFTVEISTPSPQVLRNDDAIAADPLFGSEIYSTATAPMSLVVGGLNPAVTYQFQFLHGEGRLGTVYNDGTITFTDSSGGTASEQLTFGTAGNNYAIVTVEVAATTSLTYDMPRTSGRGPSYSGMAVSAVPEPAIATVGAAGLFCLLAFTRRFACTRRVGGR